jgi:hypothetical protein
VCYFLAIGAVADPLRLSAFFEDLLDVDVTSARGTIAAAFPEENVVRVLTRGGCSCELLEFTMPADSGGAIGSIWLTAASRRALAAAAAELGSICIYVKSRREWRPGGAPRLTMTLEELLQSRVSVPADVLIDVVVRIPRGSLN